MGRYNHSLVQIILELFAIRLDLSDWYMSIDRTQLLKYSLRFVCLWARYCLQASICVCLSSMLSTRWPACMATVRFCLHSLLNQWAPLSLTLPVGFDIIQTRSTAWVTYSLNAEATRSVSSSSTRVFNTFCRNSVDWKSIIMDSSSLRSSIDHRYLLWDVHSTCVSAVSTLSGTLQFNEIDNPRWSDSGSLLSTAKSLIHRA